MTHFNNAGAALMPDQVIDAVAEFTRREIEIGSYAAQVEFADRFERVYDAAAGLLNCDRNAISITSGGSEAWWRAFMAVPLEPGDRIVAGRGEFVSSAAGLVKARADGVEVVTVPTLADGTTDLEGRSYHGGLGMEYGFEALLASGSIWVEIRRDVEDLARDGMTVQGTADTVSVGVSIGL